MKNSTIFAATFLALTFGASAAPVSLALRYETNGVQIHNGFSSQTIESSYGTNLLGLSFTGTNTYDFYSQPLSTAFSFTSSDKAGGTIVMSNSAPTSANDFSVNATMAFYDYNPLTGTDILLVKADQTAAVSKNVHHGKIARLNLNQNPQHIQFALPAGHELHIAVTLVLDSGDPGTFGQLLYNGPRGVTTTAIFPRNSTLPTIWNSPNVQPVPPSITTISLIQPDGSAKLDCSCGFPGYYWIQCTTNLNDPSSWVTISTNLADSSGYFEFIDTDAPNYPCRYYRIAAP